MWYNYEDKLWQREIDREDLCRYKTSMQITDLYFPLRKSWTIRIHIRKSTDKVKENKIQVDIVDGHGNTQEVTNTE